MLSKAREEVEKISGDIGLLIYQAINFTAWLPMVGSNKKVMQYEIGNVVLASEMIRHHSAASLYAPLRITLYESETGLATFEYDQPTSMFGQLKDPNVQKVAEKLDHMLHNVLISVSK